MALILSDNEINKLIDENPHLNKNLKDNDKTDNNRRTKIKNYKIISNSQNENDNLLQPEPKIVDYISPDRFTFEDKKAFLEAVCICCDAAKIYADRFVELATKMAKDESDNSRRHELEKIAEVCKRAYRALNMQCYARFDIRISPTILSTY